MTDLISEFTGAELDLLPIKVRNLVAACCCNGHSYDAAATQYGLPLGTVKSRINRARAKIAKHRAEAKAEAA
jgi:DNA-directed RNA polymerase specialized sigma24 family protein